MGSVFRVYLINVPWVFMAPWSVIKKGCHPVTLEKLRIFRDKQTFLQHFEQDLGIPAHEVPMENGGTGPSLVDLPTTPLPTTPLSNLQGPFDLARTISSSWKL